ncbi:unnamed protein product [Cunninghamella blakesleeana]
MTITPSTLLFESGIMKLSDYDPINDRYQLVRTLELPNLPSFEPLDMPSFLDNNHRHHYYHHYHQENPLSLPSSSSSSSISSSNTTINNSQQQRCQYDQTLSRFTECFEKVPLPSSSNLTNNYASTLRSTKSVSSKKSIRLMQKPPRRCNSNPNLSKKKLLDNSIPEFDQSLLSTLKETQTKQQVVITKKSISNAFQRLTGFIPKTNKKALLSKDDVDDNKSETSTIRQAWTNSTWLDDMKVSMESNHHLPFPNYNSLSKRQQTKSWWTMTSSNSTSSIPSICV